MPTKNSTLLSLIAARLVLTETAQSQPYLAMATLIAPDLAITPDHVFGNRRRVNRNVTLHFDGRTDLPIETEATVIARDPDFDIANLPNQLLADADPPSGASWQSLMITPATPKGAYVTVQRLALH
jgi:hypothetical protein